MTEYELLYVIGETKDMDSARIKEEVKAIVEGEGGKYDGAERLEKRKLAYVVKRETRGTYVAQRFLTEDRNVREASIEAGEESVIGRINHKLNLYRDILRFIIVRAENLPPLVMEEGASKVVAEVASEARKTVAEKKAVAAPKVEAIAEAPVAKDESEEKEPKKKTVKTKKSEGISEADLDKQLEEVLHI